MKKLIALFVVASFGMALVGCGKKATDDSSGTAPAVGKDKTPKTDDEG